MRACAQASWRFAAVGSDDLCALKQSLSSTSMAYVPGSFLPFWPFSLAFLGFLPFLLVLVF